MIGNVLMKKETDKLHIQSCNSGVEIMSRGQSIHDNFIYIFVEIFKAYECFYIHCFFAHNSVRLTDIILSLTR
jgi:hypothetical protein